MANLYQSVLDEAAEKRRRLMEKGYEPPRRLVEKVRACLRQQEEKRVDGMLKPRSEGKQGGH